MPTTKSATHAGVVWYGSARFGLVRYGIKKKMPATYPRQRAIESRGRRAIAYRKVSLSLMAEAVATVQDTGAAGFTP